MTWKGDPLLVPFWDTTAMYRESAMLRAGDHGVCATLLFPPDSITAVTNAAGDQVYEEGVDFIVERAQRRLVRTPGSRMPWVQSEAASLHGELTHDRTIAISYTHARNPMTWRPEAQLARLPQLADRVGGSEPIGLCVIGDSISAGYDASGFHGFPPFQPPYAPLVARAIESVSGARVRLDNLATAGWTAADGLWEAERIAASQPDLVIVAFGMNDAAYAGDDEFAANISTLLDGVRAGHPSAEFLLVSPMLPTRACTWVDPSRFAGYQERLRALGGDGVAFVDMTRLWSEIGQLKTTDDLSGNGLNHPNDFGQRLYAHTISAALWPGGSDEG
jgi:lysophospholipase L1-like esterase